jgi:uncharacterized protein (TIGR00369 family)
VGRVEVAWTDPDGYAAAADMTGRAWIEAMRDGTLPLPAIAALLDFAVMDVGDGTVRLRAVPGERHLNPMGSVHGGFAMTVLDTAMAMAIFTRMPAGRGPLSIEIQTRFHRPVFPGTGPVTAEGRVLHVGATTATAEADMRDAGDRLLAHATCTCAIVAVST